MLTLTINGEVRTVSESLTLADLLGQLGYDRRRIAVEINREVVPLHLHGDHRLCAGDDVEIVTLVGGGAPNTSHDTPLRIGSFTFQSRLITGTGKYACYELMRECLAASGCQVTTVAVRRERLVDKEGRNILDYLDLKRYTILPNTAGCFSAEDAVRHARLARELLANLGNPGAGWVKLECLGDRKTLLPDPVATL
jgi:thiazole synthase